MDLPPVLDVGERVGADVERLADDVEHMAKDAFTNRHGYASAGVPYEGPAPQAVGGLHADDASPALPDLLRNLGHDGDGRAFELGVHLHGMVDLRERVGRELDVDDRTGDRNDPSILEAGIGT